MSKNTTTTTLASILVVIAIYAYFSPQVTMWSISKAGQSNDIEALKGLMVLEAVKSSLAEDLRGQVVASAMKEMGNNPSAETDLAKANLLIFPVVEALVMPANLAYLISEGKVKENIIPGKTPENPQNSGSTVEGRYEGYSRYHVLIRPKTGNEGDLAHFFLKRESILTWKLERIVLPAKSTDLFGGVRGKTGDVPKTPVPAPSTATAGAPAPVEPPPATVQSKDKSRQIEVAKYLAVRLVGKKNTSGENDLQQVLVEVALENKSGKTVKGVESKLKINDSAGDGIMNIAFSYDQEIAPGSTATYRGLVDINKDVENDRYLWDTNVDKLNAEFETSAIAYADGTRMEAP